MKRKRHILAAITILTIAGFLLLARGIATSSPQKPITAAPVAVHAPLVTHPDVTELLIDVNNERVKAGLPALVLDDRLVASASEKCADEDVKGYRAHYSPTGEHYPVILQRHIAQYAWADENLAWGFDNAQSTTVAWMASPAHRAAILDTKYSLVGYASCGNNLVVAHMVGF